MAGYIKNPDAHWVPNRWLRFLVGLVLLTLFFCFLSTTPHPPGVAGKLIQRNLQYNVQATALFYSDLERMPQIEQRLDAYRE